jgi:hypothetical protein
MTNNKTKTSLRFYDPPSEGFISEQNLKEKVMASAREHHEYELEELTSEHFGYTLEEAAMHLDFPDGPRSEKLIKFELESLRKEKPEDRFEDGMIQGKITILEAVLNNVEFENEDEL